MTGSSAPGGCDERGMPAKKPACRVDERGRHVWMEKSVGSDVVWLSGRGSATLIPREVALVWLEALKQQSQERTPRVLRGAPRTYGETQAHLLRGESSPVRAHPRALSPPRSPSGARKTRSPSKVNTVRASHCLAKRVCVRSPTSTRQPASGFGDAEPCLWPVTAPRLQTDELVA